MGVISLAKPDLSVKHEGLVASLHYIWHPPRAAEPGGGARGALAPQFLNRRMGTLHADNQLLRILSRQPTRLYFYSGTTGTHCRWFMNNCPMKLRTELCWGQILALFSGLCHFTFCLHSIIHGAEDQRKTGKAWKHLSR